MKKKGETFIRDDFELSAATLAWCARKYPMVDVEATLENFKRKAKAEGWMYRNWDSGFETVVSKGMQNGWRSIVTIKAGREYDPKWQPVLHEARKKGFREPHEHETVGVYRTQMMLWEQNGKPRDNVIDLSQVMKRVNRG